GRPRPPPPGPARADGAASPPAPRPAPGGGRRCRARALCLPLASGALLAPPARPRRRTSRQRPFHAVVERAVLCVALLVDRPRPLVGLVAPGRRHHRPRHRVGGIPERSGRQPGQDRRAERRWLGGLDGADGPARHVGLDLQPQLAARSAADDADLTVLSYRLRGAL